VGIYDFIRLALPWDTLIADAMLRACGVTREQARSIVKRPMTEYGGMRECFENRTRVRL
jgi:hypothetical protein